MFSVFFLFLIFAGSHVGATFHLEKVREVKRSTPRKSEKLAFSPEGPRGSLEGLLEGWGSRGPCREGGKDMISHY